MSNLFPVMLSAAISDIFGAIGLGIGGITGATAGAALHRVLQRRSETARDILLEEIRRGERHITSPEVDEAVAVICRYHRAAVEGAARLNLRLMARVIAGEAHLGRLTASEFLRDADLLASLQYREVVVLSYFVKGMDIDAVRAAHEGARAKEILTWVSPQVIPAIADDEDELLAICAAIVRTGLLQPQATFGKPMYSPTGLLRQLNERVMFEEAIGAEPT